MQRDKAALSYHGKPQLQWAFDLLSEFTAATFVSVRPDQRDEELRRTLPQIVDRHPGIGPLAGIEAALLSHPKAAWLVVACDLPFIDAEDLGEPDPAELRERALIAERAALGVRGVTNSSGAGASASASTVALATSGGFSGAYRITGHGCSASVIAGAPCVASWKCLVMIVSNSARVTLPSRLWSPSLQKRARPKPPKPLGPWPRPKPAGPPKPP